jgi:archaellum biogenesis ATPase FlaH
MEKRLLSAAIKERESYEEIFSRIRPDNLSPIGLLVFGLIREFYDRDVEAKWVEREVLIERAEAKVPNPKQAQAIKEYILELNPEISVPNLFHDIKTFKQQRVGDELALAITNRDDPRNILDLMTRFQELEHVNPEDDEQVYQEFSVRELVTTSFDPANQIKLFPKELNDRVDGGARPGHHLLVYARPEMGKTLFLINMAAGFLLQNLTVLYVGNEDPASDILLRVVSRLSKMTKQQVLDNPGGAQELAMEKGYDKLILAALSPGNFFEIRKLIERFRPDVLIIDQLRNIEVKADSRTLQLEKAATSARNVAKQYGILVVSATQAGESAEGKAILGRDDIDFSKTGIQAQVDLMVGIGADDTMEKHGLRTINLPKNKLSGNHEHFTVSVNPSIGSVEPIVT